MTLAIGNGITAYIALTSSPKVSPDDRGYCR